MAFCVKCGNRIDENEKFCNHCGTPVKVAEKDDMATVKEKMAKTGNLSEKLAAFNNTADTSGEYDAKDISDNKLMAVLAYLGPLWLIPFITKKDSRFTRFHCRQGFNLLLVDIAYSVISAILSAIIKTPHYIYGVYYGSYTPGWFSVILWLVSIPLFALSVIGILNANNGKAKELPIIGKFKIIKQ